MNEITATATMPPPSRELRDKDLRCQGIVDQVVMFWPNDGSQVSLRREMTQVERGNLRLRQRDLHMILRPLNLEERKHAAKALAAMFLGFPNMRSADAQATVAAYVMALESYPLFSIVNACADVTQRLVDINPDFPPTAPRMCEIATRHLISLRAELAIIEKTITGRVEVIDPRTQEERDAIAGKLRELADSMMERDRIQRREHLIHQAVVLQEANTKALLDEYKRIGIDPVYADADGKILLSPALAGKLPNQPK